MGRSHVTGVKTVMETVKKLGIQENVLLGTMGKDKDGNETWENDYNTKTETWTGKRTYINCLKLSKGNKNLIIRGLQAFNNEDFGWVALALQEFFTGENVTGFNVLIDGKEALETYLKGSKTTSTRHNGHVEYAKDSYHWSQIDLLDKWHAYCESLMDADYENATDISIDDFREGLKQFLLNAMKKTVQCNPCMRGWSAERLEDCYITHGILPRFIKEQLKIDLKKEDLQEIQKAYLSRNPELFNDCLHRLSNDTMVKDDLLFTMGYTQEGI